MTTLSIDEINDLQETLDDLNREFEDLYSARKYLEDNLNADITDYNESDGIVSFEVYGINGSYTMSESGYYHLNDKLSYTTYSDEPLTIKTRKD